MALDFDLTEDQQAIADVFGAFFGAESPGEVVRAAEPLGFSPELWTKVCAMEAPGMGAPAGSGGGGASLADLVVVAQALGAAVAPVPLIEHWVASRLHPVDDVVSGAQIATVSLRPADADGVWSLVPAGAIAPMVIGIDGNETVAVVSDPPGDAPANHASAPIADRDARVGMRTVLGDASVLEHALDEWRCLTAAALVGIADRALQIGVEYTLDRTQFGRPIGAYQAVQHGLADIPALADGARFLAHKAAWAHGEGLIGAAGTIDMDEGIVDEFASLASMAFIAAAEAAAIATDRSLHYHGGYGFSEEYDIQLYFRRSRGWAGIVGDRTQERLRLADMLWPAVGGN